jgi:hypothetical protein
MSQSEKVIVVPIGVLDPKEFLINLDKSISEIFMLVFERQGLDLDEDEWYALWNLAFLQSQMKIWQKC